MILRLQRKRLYEKQCIIGFTALYLLACGIWMHKYLDVRTLNFQLGCLSLLFCTRLDSNLKGRYRFAVVALLLTALDLWIHIKTLTFLALLAGLLFTVESFAGSLNHLPLLILPLMTPMADYIATVFSFPIRLELSRVAGTLLRMGQFPVTVSGNLMLINGQAFSVDPACMGLHMLLSSILAGIMLIAIADKRYGRRTDAGLSLCVLGAIVGLNLAANVLRIAIIVAFQAMPETSMHTMAGLVCFCAGVLLPAYFMTVFAVQRWSKPAPPAGKVVSMVFSSRLVWWNVLLMLLIFTVSARRLHAPVAQTSGTAPLPPPGFHLKTLDDQISQLDNGALLVYIKPVRGFYAPDHNPSICWAGSGYTFEDVSSARDFYTAHLRKGNELLYTAWWYDNGNTYTNSQWAWRWDAFLHPHTYAIVNVTAATEPAMLEAITRFRQEGPCRSFVRKAIVPGGL